MGYRDDHEAALARMDALTAELARARTDDVQQEARIAALEAELAEERDKAARAQAALDELRPPAPEPPPPKVVSEAESDPIPALVFFGLMVAACVLIAIVGALR